MDPDANPYPHSRYGLRIRTRFALTRCALSAPQTPKLDLRGPHCTEREGRETYGVIREMEEREGRDNERRDGSEGKRWALADFGGQEDHGPLRCQTLSCFFVYPNSAERNNVVF